jgi:putative hydrolase of the HAD superfamily
VRAVLLDVLGTLVRLEPPALRLRAALRDLTGVDVGAGAAERAFRAEIGYYLAHHLEGPDPEGLASLRDRCAGVVAAELGRPELDPAVVRQAMLDSLEFTPFPDAAPALAGLRERGLALVAVSNWDCSLPQVLERAGLHDLLDGVVSSAVVGRAKPAREVFEEGLRSARVDAPDALHVGDSLENDVEGARAAGIRAVLLARDGAAPPDVEAIRSLAELPALIS